MTSPDVHPRQCSATTDHAAHFWETPSLGWRYCRGVGYSASPAPAPAVDWEGVVTEHAIEMSSGDMKIRNADPEIERIYPLAQWIPAHQRFGGKVWRRRIRVVEDWVEVPKDGGEHR